MADAAAHCVDPETSDFPQPAVVCDILRLRDPDNPRPLVTVDTVIHPNFTITTDYTYENDLALLNVSPACACTHPPLQV